MPAFAQAWLEQRRAGAIELAEIERRELAELSDADALRWADILLDAVPAGAFAERRGMASGLVEQQRLFARARR